MASSEYKLAVVNGTSLSLSLSGPAGPTGATGGVTSVAGRTGAITLVSADISNASTGGFGTADAGKLVKFNSTGGASFRSNAVDTFAVSANSISGSGLYGASTEGYGVFALSDSYRALYAVSISGAAVYATCDTSTGSVSISSQGTYHALFGDTGSNRSFIARVKGALGWFRNSDRTLTIEAAATLDASRTYIIPDATGTTVPIVPAYADITAANAALPANEFYWDTTDKKLRVTTT